MFNLPELKAIGTRYSKMPAQIMLRLHIRRGVVVIPKSTHIEQNFRVLGQHRINEQKKNELSRKPPKGRVYPPISLQKAH